MAELEPKFEELFEELNIIDQSDDPILSCDVCGSTENVSVHSAINMPISFAYCKRCDAHGYITLFELLKYLANPEHNKAISEEWNFIQENMRVILNYYNINSRDLYSSVIERIKRSD